MTTLELARGIMAEEKRSPGNNPPHAVDLASALLAAADREAILREGLERVRRYGLDTLSGPAASTGVPDDMAWHRDGVVELIIRATEALKRAGEVKP